MIQMEGISKLYKGTDYTTVALENVHLHIDRGDFVAIMGPSGSGKTTLLHIIGCMNSPTAGTYLLDGQDVTSCKSVELAELRKKYISFVFQNFALMPNYTVFENMEIPLLAKNVGKKERKQRIISVLRELGLENLINKFPAQISGGQQQRVGIARALVSENEIVLADEPTGALDQHTSEELMDLFDKVNKAGKTVILITHDSKVAERAKRLLYIKDGSLQEVENYNKIP